MTQDDTDKASEATLWPLTEAQSGLWYTQRIDPANPILNTGQYLEISGPLDVEIFVRAFDRVMAECDAFRLRFRETSEGPRQWLDPNLTPRLKLVDLAQGADPEADALAELRKDTATPVDLETGPVAAFHLYRLSANRWFFYERIHHLAIDGYAIVLVTNRIADVYSALKARGPVGAPFPPLATALEDDAAYGASERRDADRDYWRAALSGLGEVTGMAAGRAVSASWFQRETTRFSAEQMQSLRALADAAKTTWPDALTALVGAYIQRFSGGGEAVIGVPFMGRLGNAAARVPCMLMNVLPLRLAPDESQPVADYLRDVSKTLIRMRRHGRYRSEQMRRELGLIGGQRRLYGALVNVQPFDMPPKMAGLDVKLHILGAGSVDDITFTFRGDAQNELVFEVDTNPNLYTPAEARCHAQRLLAFLDAATSAGSLIEIPTASPQEAHRAIFDLNATDHTLSDVTLVDLIETKMRETPDAVALVFEGASMTYGDLDRRTAALAAQLSAMGAGQERIVAVALPRSFELLIALVAVLRSGAAYLPLDLEHPRDRLQRILGFAEPVCVLTTRDHTHLLIDDMLTLTTDKWQSGPSSDKIPPPLTPPLKGEGDSDSFALPLSAGGNFGAHRSLNAGVSESPSPLRGGVRGGGEPPSTISVVGTRPAPADMAYVIYTSGSTGDPKGVVIEHRAIVNRLEWMREHYGFTPQDRILQKTPATFDVSVWEFFLPLITGATLVIAPPGAHRDPQAIADIIRRERISTCHFVPSMLSAFLASPASQGITMARVFCSGEELTGDQRDRFHKTLQAELHNLYGPTEAAVDVSYWPASAKDRSSPVPIGFPVWNTRLYVLDEHLRPLPPGVVGHLYLAGVQLARGYLGRPDLTAERFIVDPFQPGERMYLTGDLARLREDGAVVFLGRSDHQVKIRGLRIELGEIEAVIMASGQVRQAGVIAREDQPGTKHIVAYLVPVTGYDRDGLRQHLAAKLPDYMVPAAFVTLDALPVTGNGKLSRAALPVPEFASGTGRKPATDTEVRLCALVAEVLGLPEPPSADADFFALGGDSLSAVNLIVAFEQAFGRDPGLGALFENSTIAALAALIDAENDAHDSGLNPIIRLAGGDEAAPPLFIVHPAGGIAWGYRHLAKALGGKRIVYGLQSPALDPAHPLPESLEALAADYVDRIRQVTDGPYHLAGWSVGGIIAQAMAVQLRALGLEVGLVALLDSYPADCWRAEPEPTPVQALRALIAIAGYDPTLYPELTSREAIVAFLRRGDSPLGNLPEAALDGVIRVVSDTNRLVRGHHHKPYDGALTHIRADLDHGGKNLVAGLWHAYARTVDATGVPFLHPQLTSVDAAALIAPRLDLSMENFERGRQS